MLAIVNVLIFSPLFWLTKTILLQTFLLLALTVAWRAYKTLLVGLRVPLVGWRPCKMRPVQPDQAVLVTGATSGIGLALSKHLFRSGYSVVAAYYDSRESGHQELKQLAAQSGAKQNRILFVELDVRSDESISRAYLECQALLAANKLHLYALINNAGLGSLQPFAWLQRKTIKNLVETNLLGNLLMTREFLPLLLPPSLSSSSDGTQTSRSRAGRILFVSSGLGLVPGATYATYGITKQAQIYLAQSLNLELEQRYGIKSIAMVPHNFIKNTNICASNVKQNELAWAELKPIERDLFGREFNDHIRLTKSLDEATRELKSRAATKGAKKTTNNPGNPLLEAARRALHLLRDIHDSLNGVNKHLSLEESGALECFERALRLESPPEIMFAGDNIFQLIVGSLLVSLPTSCSSLLGNAVAPSLYK